MGLITIQIHPSIGNERCLGLPSYITGASECTVRCSPVSSSSTQYAAALPSSPDSNSRQLPHSEHAGSGGPALSPPSRHNYIVCTIARIGTGIASWAYRGRIFATMIRQATFKFQVQIDQVTASASGRVQIPFPDHLCLLKFKFSMLRPYLRSRLLNHNARAMRFQQTTIATAALDRNTKPQQQPDYKQSLEFFNVWTPSGKPETQVFFLFPTVAYCALPGTMGTLH